MMSFDSPDGVVHHLLNLVPYYVIDEGEPLEVDDENMRQPPNRHLLGGLSVLLALRAIPTEEVTHLEPLIMLEMTCDVPSQFFHDTLSSP